MTETNTETTNTISKLTTVKTVYARAAVVLLALNFCLTGYVVMSLNKTTQEQIESTQSATTTSGASATSKKEPSTTKPSPVSTGGDSVAETREKN